MSYDGLDTMCRAKVPDFEEGVFRTRHKIAEGGRLSG